MIWRKLGLLAALAVAWVFLFFLLFAFFVFGDCFNEQCRANQVWSYRAVVAFIIVSYAAIAWWVLKSKRLD